MDENKVPLCTTFSMKELPESFQDWARNMKNIAPGADTRFLKSSKQKTDLYRFASSSGWKRFLFSLVVIFTLVPSVVVVLQFYDDFISHRYTLTFLDSSLQPSFLLSRVLLVGVWLAIFMTFFWKLQSPFGSYLYLTPEFLFEIQDYKVCVYSWAYAKKIKADILQSASVVRFQIGKRKFRLLVSGWHYASFLSNQLKKWTQVSSGVDPSPEFSEHLLDSLDKEEGPKNSPPFSKEWLQKQDMGKPKASWPILLLKWGYPVILSMLFAHWLSVYYLPLQNSKVFKSVYEMCQTEDSCSYLPLWKNPEFQEGMDDFWYQKMVQESSQIHMFSSDRWNVAKSQIQGFRNYQHIFPNGKHIQEMLALEKKIDDSLFLLAQEKLDEGLIKYHTFFQGKGIHEGEIEKAMIARLPQVAKLVSPQCQSKLEIFEDMVERNPCQPELFFQFIKILSQNNNLEISVIVQESIPDPKKFDVPKWRWIKESHKTIVNDKKKISLIFSQEVKKILHQKTIEAFSTLLPFTKLSIEELPAKEKVSKQKRQLIIFIEYQVYFLDLSSFEGTLSAREKEPSPKKEDSSIEEEKFDAYMPILVGSVTLSSAQENVKSDSFLYLAEGLSTEMNLLTVQPSYLFANLPHCIHKLFGVQSTPLSLNTSAQHVMK